MGQLSFSAAVGPKWVRPSHGTSTGLLLRAQPLILRVFSCLQEEQHVKPEDLAGC